VKVSKGWGRVNGRVKRERRGMTVSGSQNEEMCDSEKIEIEREVRLNWNRKLRERKFEIRGDRSEVIAKEER